MSRVEPSALHPDPTWWASAGPSLTFARDGNQHQPAGEVTLDVEIDACSVDGKGAQAAALSPWRFVMVFGVVGLLADTVYEGARSITGPFLGPLLELDDHRRRHRDSPLTTTSLPAFLPRT
ncbi:hypothetical protein [Actinomadura citrea]|uniref:Uncharacterized protein n=1 Tax=Actinomadura citrea TaxID=46158 RepID=A0A7Y9GE90_9ACTN|nr:hypothetical protein [Actinomadura citrea]NYE14771.1 hypothetical protein [Actinomadura citrea]